MIYSPAPTLLVIASQTYSVVFNFKDEHFEGIEIEDFALKGQLIPNPNEDDEDKGGNDKHLNGPEGKNRKHSIPGHIQNTSSRNCYGHF